MILFWIISLYSTMGMAKVARGFSVALVPLTIVLFGTGLAQLFVLTWGWFQILTVDTNAEIVSLMDKKLFHAALQAQETLNSVSADFSTWYLWGLIAFAIMGIFLSLRVKLKGHNFKNFSSHKRTRDHLTSTYKKYRFALNIVRAGLLFFTIKWIFYAYHIPLEFVTSVFINDSLSTLIAAWILTLSLPIGLIVFSGSIEGGMLEKALPFTVFISGFTIGLLLFPVWAPIFYARRKIGNKTPHEIEMKAHEKRVIGALRHTRGLRGKEKEEAMAEYHRREKHKDEMRI